MGPGPLVLQQLLWRHVCEEDLQDDLGVLAVFGVGVPHDAVSKESLWVGLTAVERARVIKQKYFVPFTGFGDMSIISEELSGGMEKLHFQLI